MLGHVNYIGMNCQPLCHAVISLNRFTAIAFLRKHSRIWNPRSVFVLIVAIAAIGILLTALPSITVSVIYARMSQKEAEQLEYSGFFGWDIEWVGAF